MNNYQQLDILGHGASGVILKVKHIPTGEIRCMKKIDFSKPNFDTKVFIHEAQIIQKLNHPNIVKYYEHFMDGKWFCIVMEFADNDDLETFLKFQKTPLSEDEILRICCQILAAVSYIHSQGIVHRDLKPGNVLLCKNGLIKIIDFGLSKSASDHLLQSQVGTPFYYSPEIVKKVPYLYEVDSWALGCIFYELISLKKAFEVNNLGLLFKKIQDGSPEPLTGSYSPELFVIVEDLLNKNQYSRLSPNICVQHPIFAQAFISLGMKFQQGIDCTQDLQLSNFFLNLALDAANLKGLGWTYHANSDKSHQLRKLKHQAEIGSVQDVYNYAVSLLKGAESTQATEDDYSLISEASKNDMSFMTYVYGLTFRFGHGSSTQNNANAMSLFQKSADVGDPNGLLEYGFSLENGFNNDAPPSKIEAMKFYKKSAEAGSYLGMNAYGFSLEKGYDGLAPRMKEAMEWYKRSAEAGCYIGMNNYGTLLLNGYDGFPSRKREAMIWYKKSAEAGDPNGMNNYGISLEDGYDDLAPRKKEAMEWYKKSAEAGDPNGMNNYGISLLNGYDDLAPRKKEAMEWYKKSAEAGCFLGMNNYGHALEIGLDGSKPNVAEAEIWYKKSNK